MKADLLKIETAFLDALAVGESGEGKHYNILFGGGHFKGYAAFPKWIGKRTSAGMTHAAGRYQFEPATWLACTHALKLPDFSPASQDTAAWWLAQTVYHHFTGHGLTASLSEGRLVGVVTALHSTWTSLSVDKFPKRYDASLLIA